MGHLNSTEPASRFSKLRIQGFRRVEDVQLELRPLSVMIGANGTGKTSVLDVMPLLANLDISMNVPSYQPLDYKLCLKPYGVAYVIEEESLGQQRDPARDRPFKHIDSRGPDVKYFEADMRKLVCPNWDYNFLETSLSQYQRCSKSLRIFGTALRLPPSVMC